MGLAAKSFAVASSRGQTIQMDVIRGASRRARGAGDDRSAREGRGGLPTLSRMNWSGGLRGCNAPLKADHPCGPPESYNYGSATRERAAARWWSAREAICDEQERLEGRKHGAGLRRGRAGESGVGGPRGISHEHAKGPQVESHVAAACRARHGTSRPPAKGRLSDRRPRRVAEAPPIIRVNEGHRPSRTPTLGS